ncbi:hypothetical protein CDAR_189371 [Caerostris darwini]|uniref:Uncharacterized protein n=1 Tax=Caerostris darwini TaxID=1538125 RepID=A0AAV4PP44_9ARAC|nr:hypothetical protein CDAR_189371 [Caerostris darwini]
MSCPLTNKTPSAPYPCQTRLITAPPTPPNVAVIATEEKNESPLILPTNIHATARKAGSRIPGALNFSVKVPWTDGSRSNIGGFRKPWTRKVTRSSERRHKENLRLPIME